MPSFTLLHHDKGSTPLYLAASSPTMDILALAGMDGSVSLHVSPTLREALSVWLRCVSIAALPWSPLPPPCSGGSRGTAF